MNRRTTIVALCVIVLAAVVAFLLVVAPPTRAGASFTFECADPSGLPTTGCDVNLDPNFHVGDAGTLLFHATTAGKRTITLPDLTGSHRIVVRATAKGSTGTNTSVIVQNTEPTGCPSGWSLMGYQSWWLNPSGEAFPGRHAHFDNFCLPVNNLIVDGAKTFTFQDRLHAQPPGARLTRVRLNVQPGGADVWVCTPSSFTLAKCGVSAWPQPDANGNLIAQFSAPVNLSAITAGRKEFRWGIYVTQPDGKVQLLSTRHEICVRSCSPAFRSGTYQGNGSWYQNDTIGYVDARIHTALPVSP